MAASFTTIIQLEGKTATGFRVPADAVATLGSGKRPKVLVTIGTHTYRSTIAVYGDEYFLPLNASNRAAAGVKSGDEVQVVLECDTTDRFVDVPKQLAAALDGHPGARVAFSRLSYTKQRERVEAVTSAKREDTRERRIAKIIAELTDA